MPDGLAHTPHLAVAAFADRELELVAGAAPAARARGGGRAVLQLHPTAQCAQGALGDGRVRDAHAVGLGDFVARMREAIGERAVVGEQDQAAAVGVEAPTGYRRRRSGISSTTVGRPPGSCAVLSVPTGLCRA